MFCFRTIFGVYYSNCRLPMRRRCTEVAVDFAWRCGCHRQAVPIVEFKRRTQSKFMLVL